VLPHQTLYSAFGKSQCTYKSCWKWLEVMSTNVYTGLNTLNFIRKHFLQICLWHVSMYAVIAGFISLSMRGR
jgi:hypothetical protein